MASLRRSNVMPTDSATSRFLYTILKQLDHKSIDWNAVAADLEITNGHAARMRFSRFKQHMEGVPPTPRRPRSEGNQHKRLKTEKKAKREKDENEDAKYKPDPGQMIKPEPSEQDFPMRRRVEFAIKSEPFDQSMALVAQETERKLKIEPREKRELVPGPKLEITPGPIEQSIKEAARAKAAEIKPEPVVKEEPMDIDLMKSPATATFTDILGANSTFSFAHPPDIKSENKVKIES